MSDETTNEPGAGGSADPSTAGSDPGALAARLAELEQVASARSADLAASQQRIGELEATLAAAQAELSTLRETTDQVARRGLDHYRRALIAEHAGEVVEELIQGVTEEALDASLELARSAYQRIAGRVQQKLGEQGTLSHTPGQRTGQDLEGLNPIEKIARGLTKS